MPTIAPATAALPSVPIDVVAQATSQASGGDFATGVATVLAVPSGPERAEAARKVVTALASTSAPRAMEFAGSFPSGITQTAALERGAALMVGADTDAALRWALSGAAGRVAAGGGRRAVVEALVSASSRRTIDILMNEPAGRDRDEALGFAAAAWARREPQAATEWVRGLPESAARTRLISVVGFELAQNDPPRAVAVAELLPEGRDRWLLTSAVAQTWVAKDAKAAFAWVNGLPAGAARDAALAGVDTGMGLPSSRRIANAPGSRGSSRTRGGGAAVAGTGGASVSASAGTNQVTNAAVVEPGDAPTFAAWVANQREGITRDEAILEYVRQRGAAEPSSVGQWLSTLPPGTARDRAIEAYAEAVATSAPADAANFLRTLPRSDQTPEMLERTARQLIRTNPAAAEAWIDQSTLPEHRKEELRRDLPR
jgi:hypothetical protein